MKAFVVLAVVAVAAGRSVDLDTLRILSNDRVLDNVLLKDRLLTNRFVHTTRGLSNHPSTFGYGFDMDTFNTWARHPVSLVPVEELISHPLFHEYLRLPLFRQFWEEYPVVFRRYVESPLFQKFWMNPEFKIYFINPVLFYKYIVPQIRVVAQYVVPTIGTGYNMEGVLGGRVFDRDVTVDDYVNRIYGGFGTHVPFYPYAYSGYNLDRYTPTFGDRLGLGINRGLTGISHRVLLNKIYKTLFLNRPELGEATEVLTDVKIDPLHKVLEPVTGRVMIEPPKVLDVNIHEKVFPQTELPEIRGYGTQLDMIEKERLLKHLLINRYITPELYTILRTLPLFHVKEIIRRIVTPTLDIERPSTLDEDNWTLPTTSTHFPWAWRVEKDLTNPINYYKVNEIMNRLYQPNIVGDRYTPVIHDLLNVLGHRRIPIPTTMDMDMNNILI